ncbi:MAG: 50S ribosome-binding GTPase, partial [Spirochaetia bacterium]|nr:50S ribosome-binding GTPase [Spirochaetia bacterium]
MNNRLESLTLAIAGNPNCGKTTLFNALTGSEQRVGNWPGVTVEKIEGVLRAGRLHGILIDLPGIYTLVPDSEDEVVARKFLAEESYDLVINMVDAANLERNLYLTTQLVEMGIPMVLVLNK